MTDLKDIFLDDEPMEAPHEFEVDLNCVVLANHRLALDSITRAEDQEIAGLQDAVAFEDSQVASSVISSAQNGFDELRRAADRLALVGVVTRMQHWIRRFVERRNLTPEKTREPKLIRQLKMLNNAVGNGPEQIRFFEDLINVRDSIIHGDARAEWKDERGRGREVADRYRNACGDVELSEEQLRDAVEKAIRQVSWYDEEHQLQQE